MDEPKPENELPPLTFEEAQNRLEQIVHALEEGRLSLDESLKYYEEGIQLLRRSRELLERAKRRIELLTGVDADGQPITQPIDDSATFDEQSPEKSPTRRPRKL